MKHKKRKLLAVVTAVFMLFTVYMIPAESVSAESSSDVEWRDGITGGAIYFDKSTKTITGCDSTVTAAIIPAMIDETKVTTIGDKAFYNRDSLTSVEIQEGVTTIGTEAFYDCDALTSVEIQEGITTIKDGAFRDCDTLSDVEIPDSVTFIGEMAFYACNISSVEIPQGVTAIGNAAFGCCSSLAYIAVDANNAKYSAQKGALFNKDKTVLIQYPIGNRRASFIVPDTVNTIGYGAFWNCCSLTDVKIPSSVKAIEGRAFCGCSALQSITIPSGVETIQWEAFASCSKLLEVKIPDSVTTIGNSAFASCSKLSTAAIPASVTSIGSSVFKPCKSLVNINVDDNNEYYTSVDGILFDKKQNELLIYPSANSGKSYVIPNSVTTIADSAFYSCKNLTDITIPDSVTTIADNAFTSCTSLTGITIPDSVNYVGDNALQNCKSLTSITVGNNNKNFSSKDGVLFSKDQTVLLLYPGGNNRKFYEIPNSVTTLPKDAFDNCDFLTGIIIPDSVTFINSNAFPCMETLTLYANKGSTAEQLLKPWYPFKEIISDAPVKVSANLSKYHDTLKVSWSKVEGADGYYVYYKKSTWNSYQKLGTTTALSYSKSKLADGAKYTFMVYPYMNIGDQKYRTKNGKSSDYVYTLKKLNKPGVKKSSRSYIRVSWNNIPGEPGYQIARSKSSTKNYKIVKRVSKNNKSAKIKTPRYKKYYYKVRAYKTVNGKRVYGPWSSGKSYRLI